MRPILSIVQLRSLGDNALTDYAADVYLELKRAEQQSQACLRRIADISRAPYRTVLKVLEGTAFAVGILTLTVSPLGLIAAFGIPALTNGVNWLADRARAKDPASLSHRSPRGPSAPARPAGRLVRGGRRAGQAGPEASLSVARAMLVPTCLRFNWPPLRVSPIVLPHHERDDACGFKDFWPARPCFA